MFREMNGPLTPLSPIRSMSRFPSNPLLWILDAQSAGSKRVPLQAESIHQRFRGHMLNLSTISLGIAALLFTAHPSHDQTFTPQSIQFIGAANYSDVELADAGGLEIGQSYTADDLTHHAQQLLDIGIFDKVSYKFDSGKLTYTVKMSPQTFPIQLSNLPLDAGESLEAKLHARIPLYHGT